MTARVVAFGEVLWDHLPTGRRLGGAPLNLIHRLNGLGHDGIMISRLGRDEAGRQAHGILLGMGLDDRLIQWDATHPTGVVRVGFDGQGVPDIAIETDVAYDYIEPATQAVDAVRGADCVCMGTLAQRNAVSRGTLTRLLGAFTGRCRFVDLNLRKDCWSWETVRATLGMADVLKVSDEEAMIVADHEGWKDRALAEVARTLAGSFTATRVAVTLGPGGALAATRDGEIAYAPGFRVNVVDTLGCGDAFSAGFLHGLLSGWELERALRYGNAAGAVVAQQCGATEPLDRAAVDGMSVHGEPAPGDPRLV